MAHYTKYTQGGVMHLIEHDKRENIHLQEHIDTTLSCNNFNLCEHSEGEGAFFRMRKKEALATGSRFNTRSVALVSCVVTLPKDFAFKDDPDKVKEFFEQCVEYLHQKHGKENCVSAWVHFDEPHKNDDGTVSISPHLHYKTMPLQWQKNKEGIDLLQFNAKAIVSRSYLKQFHTDLQKHLEAHFCCDINILNGATAGGNKTVLELKNETVEKQINEKHKELLRLCSLCSKELQALPEFKKLMTENEELQHDAAMYRDICNRIDELATIAPETANNFIDDLNALLSGELFEYYKEQQEHHEAPDRDADDLLL